MPVESRSNRFFDVVGDSAALVACVQGLLRVLNIRDSAYVCFSRRKNFSVSL